MIRLVLPLIALLLLVWFFKAYKQGDVAKRKKLVFGFLFALFFGFIVFMTVTGRLHYIAAIVTGLLPFMRRLLPYLRYVPLLRRLVKGRDQANKENVASSAVMTPAQALDILGLEEGASEQDVVEAHRKLMQKCHPDRGGSDFLAAQLNQAKDTLLKA